MSVNERAQAEQCRALPSSLGWHTHQSHRCTCMESLSHSKVTTLSTRLPSLQLILNLRCAQHDHPEYMPRSVIHLQAAPIIWKPQEVRKDETRTRAGLVARKGGSATPGTAGPGSVIAGRIPSTTGHAPGGHAPSLAQAPALGQSPAGPGEHSALTLTGPSA